MRNVLYIYIYIYIRRVKEMYFFFFYFPHDHFLRSPTCHLNDFHLFFLFFFLVPCLLSWLVFSYYPRQATTSNKSNHITLFFFTIRAATHILISFGSQVSILLSFLYKGKKKNYSFRIFFFFFQIKNKTGRAKGGLSYTRRR